MILPLYRTLTTFGQPLIRFYLSRRLKAGKESRERFGERLGQAARERPEGKLAWIHAASVGESLSLLPLIERLRKDRPDWHILCTTGTVTSAMLMTERLPEGAFHQFVPVDRVAYVERFLTHWRPDLVLWAESEFWPNLISRAGARKLPMVLLNGRISEKSFKGWKRFPGLIRSLLGAFSLCLGQSETDAERLVALGAPHSKSVGNLKFAAPPLPADESTLKNLADKIGNRPCWLAASTHRGEEEIAGEVHLSLKKRYPNLLTLIVPRHPGRGVEAATALKARGLSVAQRSVKNELTKYTDIYLADTMGEMGLFYRLAPIVFMGKSILGWGGQNPLEAARLNAALLLGPNMTNFEEITAKFERAHACRRVADADALKEAVADLLDNDGERTRMTKAALNVAKNEAGVLDAVMEELSPYLKGEG